jgi:membrane associated rhomboid family serine protease
MLDPPTPPSSGDASPSAEGQPTPTARSVTFGDVLRAATPVVWVTPAIVGINVLILVAMIATGVPPNPSSTDLLKWGANFGPAIILDGEWWRLVTAAFLHVSVFHLGFNMYALWRAGALAERVYGNAAFLLLYVVAALGGSLVSTLASPLVLCVGASGAIFGVYGAILAFARTSGRNLPTRVAAGITKSALGFVVYNLGFGLTIPNISNSAHLGGLVTGFITGWLLARDLRAPEASGARRYLRASGVLLVVAALAWGARYRVLGQLAVRAQDQAQDVLPISRPVGGVRSAPPRSAPADCSSALASCGKPGLACVSLRWSDVGQCRDSGCLQELSALLKAKGVTASVSRGGLRSEDGQPGCVGIRTDIGGTNHQAECLAELLGANYSVDPTTCNADGYPHMVIAR